MARKANVPGSYEINGVWYVRTDPLTGRKLSSRLRDTKAFEAWYRGRQRLAADPRNAAASRATFDEWASRTLAEKRRIRAEGTGDFYEEKLGSLLRLIGRSTRMSEITPNFVDKLIAQRESEGIARNTISHELGVLVQVCKLAKRAGEYAGDISSLKPVGYGANYVPRKRWLTKEEVAKLEAIMPPERFAWVAFEIATGTRYIEVTRAMPGDYDPVTGTIMIHGSKTKKSNSRVPVLSKFERLLHRALPYLPLSWPRVAHDLPEWCAKAGIPHATTNDLRRTHASWLKQAGVSSRNIGGMLRHESSIMADKVYAQDEAVRLGERINAELGAVPETSDTEQEQEQMCIPGTKKPESFCLVAPPGVEPGRLSTKDFKAYYWTCARAKFNDLARLRVHESVRSRLKAVLNSSHSPPLRELALAYERVVNDYEFRQGVA
jgi:integrase